MENKNTSVQNFITENNLLYNLAALVDYIYEAYDEDELQELIDNYSNNDVYFEIGNDNYLVLSNEEMIDYCKDLSYNVVDSIKHSLKNSSLYMLDDFISWEDYEDYIIDDYVNNFEEMSGSVYCESINGYEIYKNE